MAGNAHGILSALEICLLNLDALKLIMTVLDALAILETATLECKQRDIYTPEVKEALDFLQSHSRPEWLIPHFRYHAQLNEVDLNKEAQEQALRAIFPCIRESVKDLLGKANGYSRESSPRLVT